MVDVFSPEYLYTSDKSPVQYGSIYEIKRYLNKAKPTGLKGYLKDLDEHAKKIELGTPWPTINIRPHIMHFRRLVFSYTE